MRCNRYWVFFFAFIVFLYAAGIVSWSIGQEAYRVVFAVAGLFSAAWLVHALAERLHEKE